MASSAIPLLNSCRFLREPLGAGNGFGAGLAAAIFQRGALLPRVDEQLPKSLFDTVLHLRCPAKGPFYYFSSFHFFFS